MWWLLKILVFVVLLVVLVLVAVNNDVSVPLNLLAWEFENVRLFLVMFGAALFGLLAGLALAGIRELQWRMHVKRHRRDHAHLEREVHELRRGPLKGLDDSSAVGDPADESGHPSH